MGLGEPLAGLVLPMAEGVGGWLLLLCRLLVVFHPLALAVTASGALGALSVRGTAVALTHNMFDAAYYASRVETTVGDLQYLAAPRTFGVTLSSKF